MTLSYTDAEVHAQAVRLGLIKEGGSLPRRQRSKVVASLIAERQRPDKGVEVPFARRIVVQPGGDIVIDGKPFPWLVKADQMSVALEPDGSGSVRLTIPAENVQIIEPKNESENRA